MDERLERAVKRYTHNCKEDGHEFKRIPSFMGYVCIYCGYEDGPDED